MSMPTDLSNEAAAWMHTQIAIANARSAALLREEIDRLDDWANGLYLVLLNVLPFLMKAHPEMARRSNRNGAVQPSASRRWQMARGPTTARPPSCWKPARCCTAC